MLKRTLVAAAAGTAVLLGSHDVQAVEMLAVRDSADFNLQINGDVAPTAILGNPTWTSDGDLITIDNTDLPAPGIMGWDGVLNSVAGYTAELRFRVTSPQVTGTGVLGVILSDATSTADYHTLVITATGVTGVVDGLDFTDGFHVLRFVDKPNSTGLSIWLDGELLVEDRHAVTLFTLNRAYLGRTGSALRDGGVEIDYFRVDTSGAYRPVPEPASIAVLSLGALALMRRRRLG